MKNALAAVRIATFGALGWAFSAHGYGYTTWFFWFALGCVTLVNITAYWEGAE